jgi:hypothetical protein
MAEWGFESDNVDLERIYIELGQYPAIYQYSYMEQLKKNAPKTYANMKKWAEEKNIMKWLKW